MFRCPICHCEATSQQRKYLSSLKLYKRLYICPSGHKFSTDESYSAKRKIGRPLGKRKEIPA